MHRAIAKNDSRTVRNLIRRHSIKLYEFLTEDRKALKICAEYGHVEVGKVLISNGAHVNGVSRRVRTTALHMACACGHVNFVKMLIESRCESEFS